MTSIVDTGTNGATGTAGTAGVSGANGTAAGAGGTGQVESDGISGQDISASADDLTAQITGGNGGVGGDGGGGGHGVETGSTWGAGGDGAAGGDGGAGGTATFALTNDTIGSVGAPFAAAIDLSLVTIGGKGESAGSGGGGGSTGTSDPAEGVVGGPGGDGGQSGDAGAGADSTDSVTNLTADLTFGGTIQVNAFAGAGGTLDLLGNRAAGGNGDTGGSGGTAEGAGNGGAAAASLTGSALTAGRSLQIDLSAQGGQGGDAGVQAAGGEGESAGFDGGNGTTANGADAGNATATLSNDTIAVGTSTQNGILTLSAEVRTYTASEGSPNAALNAAIGLPGATAPGHITFTDNTVALGAGAGVELGALLTLQLSDTTIGTGHEFVTEPSATNVLNAGVGGNLDFNGNAFDGGGGGSITLEVADGGVTVDTLHNAISIGGSVDNAFIGFNTFQLDNNDTFVAGRDSYFVTLFTGDTVDFTAGTGNLTLVADGGTVATDGLVLNFEGFGPGLNMAALDTDTSVVSGNTFVKIGGQTLEILGYTGSVDGFSNFTALPTESDVVVTVAQMEGFAAAHTLPTAGSTYIVTDSAANIEAATAPQLRAFAANGASAIVSTDKPLAFTVAQALQFELELTVTAPVGDSVTLADTAADIETLTATEIAELPGTGIEGIVSTDASVVLNVAQAEAFAASGLSMTVPNGDTFTVADTSVALENLSPTEIAALKAAGFTGLTATTGSPVFDVAQALALADPLPVSVTLGSTVTLSDTAAEIETLTAGTITALSKIGFTGFTATDASVVLTVAQAEALGNGGIVLTVPAHDTVTVSDTAANIEALSKSGFLALHAAGVNAIVSTDASVVLSITQAQGLEFPLPVAVPNGDTLTVADTAANIEILRAGDIGQLEQIGFTRVTATDTSVVLTLADAEAFATDGISLSAPAGHTVTVADTAADIQALNGTTISELQAAGVTAITSTDMAVNLTLTQSEALAGAGITLTAPSGDSVKYSDTILNLQALTTTQIGQLAAAGVTFIAATDSGSPGFSVAQALALQTGNIHFVGLSGATEHIADTAADIETLTPDQIEALAAVGFLALNSFGEQMTLSLAQVQALEQAKIAVPFDTVTVDETAAEVQALTSGDISALQGVGVGTISADGPVTLSVAQLLSFNGVIVTVPGGDSVTVTGTAADIAALSTDQIGTLSNAGAAVIQATDGPVTLTPDQVQTFESFKMTVTAPKGDAVILADTAANIEALGQSDIAALQAAGVTAVRATDASIVLNVAALQTFETAGLTLSAPSGDGVTIADSAANIETLTDIGALSAAGVTALNATDASLVFTVSQGLVLLGDKIAVSVPAGDGVTIADSEAAIGALSAIQIAGLKALGVTELDVPSLTGAAPVTVQGGLIFAVDGTISAGQAVAFSGPGGVLALADPADDAGTISNFGASDTIDLTSVAFDPTGNATLGTDNGLSIVENGNAYNLQLDPADAFLGDAFNLSDDGHGGTDVTVAPAAITTFVTVSAGQTALDILVGNGGAIDVLSGGAVAGGTVNSGGSITVEDHGAISGTAIEDGGMLVVNSGGTTVGVMLNDPGTETVNFGGTASGTTINGGEQYVLGSSTNVDVGNAGFLTVESGGVADGITVSSGGFIEIESDGIASGVTVLAGGEIILDGGTVSGLNLSAGASEFINLTVPSGQTASDTVLSSGVTQTVELGGKTVSVSVQTGGNQYVHGSANGTVVSGQFAYQYAFAGGTTIGTIIRNSGNEYVYSAGLASGTMISSGGREVVNASGHTSGVTVSNGGSLEITTGGVASGVTVSNGGTLEFDGGKVSGVTAESGADLQIVGVTTVSGLTVGKGVALSVFSGGTASAAAVGNGGKVIVSSGGHAVGTTISSGGSEIVSSGATASATHVQKGGEIVYAGGAIAGTVVSSGGVEGVATGVKVNGLTVSSGATLFVSSGATASATHVLKGGEIVYAGGTIAGTLVGSGGAEGVATGVKVTGLTVGSGATLFVSSGATASATHVQKGGAIVYAGGTIVGTVFSSGGAEGIAAGVKVTGLTVGSGATLSVSSGATASKTVLNGGAEVVSSGGVVAGAVTFEGAGGKLSVAATPTAALTISGFKTKDVLDLADFGFKATDRLSFAENAAKTSGVLTISSGALRAKITLFGQYVAGGFHLAADGAGTAITYQQPAAAAPDILVHHS